jgi:DNA repair protein RadD
VVTTLFRATEPPPIAASAIPPRPYQLEALDAIDDYLRTKPDNPCCVLPTGAGKSLVIAWAIQRWKLAFPELRVMILAHRKELVDQNAKELLGLWPGGDIGVYAAGLNRRDVEESIIYASIDSVYNKAGLFAPFHVIIVDEAHRIPARGEGKYLTLVKDFKRANPKLRVVGFTATPERLGMGPICHKDHILNEVCYEANVGDLIRDGYLCRLRSKVGADLPDLSEVKRNGKGDYVTESLAQAVEVPDVVQGAVRDAWRIINAENRKSVVFFCVDHAHCEAVALELRRYGVEAPVVTSETKPHERDRIVEWFKQGRYRVLLNINVYTEGFNAKRVDCVVLLRPTLSRSLYAQMVGRGLRLHPEKDDCLVLDYARCIETHGPIDCLEVGTVKVIECGSVPGPQAGEDEEGPSWPKGCGDTFSRALRECPHCGWPIPPQEVARATAEAAEAERRMHEAKAAQRSILGSEPEEVAVDDVTLHRHRKPGMPDSLMVQYRCGLSTFREWVCLDHEGQVRAKARAWWAQRFGTEEARAITVDDAVDDLFTAQTLKRITKAITVVRRNSKHFDVVGYKLDRGSGGSA